MAISLDLWLTGSTSLQHKPNTEDTGYNACPDARKHQGNTHYHKKKRAC